MSKRLKRADGTASVGLTEIAFVQLRRAIIECDLAPGEMISQEGLIERYQLTKAAVRGALARLEQDGMVVARPRQGYQVAPLTIRDIEDLMSARALIEPAVTRMAAGRIDTEAGKTLKKLATVGFRSGDRASQASYLEANRAFHMTIARCAGNARLEKMLGQILDELTRATFLTMFFEDHNEEWQDGHAKILDALDRGDGEEASRLCLTEIGNGREALLRAVLNNTTIADSSIAQRRPARTRAPLPRPVPAT